MQGKLEESKSHSGTDKVYNLFETRRRAYWYSQDVLGVTCVIHLQDSNRRGL